MSAAHAPEELLLEIRGLRKSFGPLEVLRGIDLDVGRKELVFVVGPSGSGKSTLLRCCNRLEEPTSGSIRFDGTDVRAKETDVNLLRRRMGMVFQSFNLYPHKTALGNVTLALRHVLRLGREQSNERAMSALTRVGLRHKSQAFPAELSGGQQQRVAIARALALEPDILLMDEPTSALDPELVGSVLSVIRELRSFGMTMLIVSHEMAFAREAADRVVFLDEGQVIEEAVPGEFFRNPQHPRTRAFLGELAGRN